MLPEPKDDDDDSSSDEAGGSGGGGEGGGGGAKGKELSTADQIRALNKEINRNIEHFINMPMSAKVRTEQCSKCSILSDCALLSNCTILYTTLY